MAKDISRELNRTLSRQDLIFRLALLFCAGLGVLFILGSVLMKDRSLDGKEKTLIFQLGHSIAEMIARDPTYSGDQKSKNVTTKIEEIITTSTTHQSLVGEILRDLGIALIISAIVTFSIEKYASDRLREHITYDVLSAAYAKVVPDKIYTQIADNVFRCDVFRRNWEVHIVSKRGQLDVINNIAIITAAYSYDVENLNERQIQYPILAAIDLDVLVPDRNIPRFLRFDVKDSADRSLVEQKNIEQFLQGSLTTVSSKTVGNLTLERANQEISLTALVDIPARGRVTVQFQTERAIRVPGNYPLTATIPADGIKIIISVDEFKLEVIPQHPDQEALRQLQQDTWYFSAGILPWQGFRFTAELETKMSQT